MTDDKDRTARFRVIVPAHKAETTIGACLDAIFAAGFSPSQCTVIDDGSPDATGDIARGRGVDVIVNERPKRPAGARNTGAAAVTEPILVFIDADVVVHPELGARLDRHFDDPTLTAVIGSYDNRPTAQSVVSRYRNLLHHITHQCAAGEAQTFWSGLGAVRRDAFEQVGGFDSNWEDIEDVEFGLRLRQNGGRIRLDPDLQGTHLKDWTAGSMFRTDLFGRAIPWTRLIRSDRIDIGLLNTSLAHRVSAASVLLLGLSLLTAVVWPAMLWVSATAALLFLAANMRLLRRLADIGGPAFALRALPFHVLHYIAAITGYAKVRLLEGSSSRE